LLHRHEQRQEKPGKGMIKFVLTIFVIAMIIVLPGFVMPGQAGPLSPVMRGGLDEILRL
jgi:hypothetical protein